MGTEKLKEAISDCIINFDLPVLITDLVQEYKLPYKEVDNIIAAHIKDQEKKGGKFEKRFLVSGEEKDSDNEIYTVVKGETKLKEWLSKLKNAESVLYSVETSGGSRTPADMFKPMTWCPNQKEVIDSRQPLQFSNMTNGNDAKPPPKAEVKKSKGIDFGAKKPAPEPVKSTKSPEVKKEVKKDSPETQKSSPKDKTTPEEKKPNAAPSNKKGIANFFAAQAGRVKSENKKATGVVKPPSPKKLENFFQKAQKPTTSVAAKEEKLANTSVQLFSDDDDDDKKSDIAEGKEEEEEEDKPHTVVDVDTSDGEEQIESLRKQCKEDEDESEVETSRASGKRRRIIDSDDDEDDEPEVKHEKKDDSKAAETEEAEKPETYLDEDGFVITIKSKKGAIPKKTIKAKTPEKSPPTRKAETKKTPKKQSRPASKTKQGNIMNFFTKK